jgi:hypothetical protein
MRVVQPIRQGPASRLWLPLRPRGLQSHLRLPLDRNRLTSLLEQGLSVKQISLRSGYSTSGVHNLIHRLGLTIPQPVESAAHGHTDPAEIISALPRRTAKPRNHRPAVQPRPRLGQGPTPSRWHPTASGWQAATGRPRPGPAPPCRPTCSPPANEPNASTVGSGNWKSD